MAEIDGIATKLHEHLEEQDFKDGIDAAMTFSDMPTETTGKDEASRLKGLATSVRDQDDLERDVNRQADQLLAAQADERDRKRLERAMVDREKSISQLRRLEARRDRSTTSSTSLRLNSEISMLETNLDAINTDLRQIRERIDERQQDDAISKQDSAEGSSNRKLPHESQREFLIRTGKITPFSKVAGRCLQRQDSSLQGVLLDAEAGDNEDVDDAAEEAAQEKLSHRHLVQPGFQYAESNVSEESSRSSSEKPTKRRRLRQEHPMTSESKDNTDMEHQSISEEQSDHQALRESDEDEDRTATDVSDLSEDAANFIDSGVADSRHHGVKRKGRKIHDSARSGKVDVTGIDDGNERLYQKRLQTWAEKRSQARIRAQIKQRTSDDQSHGLAEPSEWDDSRRDERTTQAELHMPHPTVSDTVFEDGYRVPGDVYPSLFDYQKTGVRWLWELYSQRVGGIVGDEMGLGKTIQVIAFLAGLHYSKKMTKPVLIVAPATVMKQWVNEFHTWWPAFRVSILHSSGSGMMNVGFEAREEEDLLSRAPTSASKRPSTKANKSARKIVDRVKQEGHILVTTYTGLQTYADLLIPTEWEYAVLDEGHKIRNPNIAITIYCKELRTPNRIILSGTPMQNNLVELWSLFDFIFPMRLGTLVNFRNQFDFPIRQGGYANATNLQVQTALRCAETLKDAISPYLLQRFKVDVASDLPKKSEQVLFCKLTKPQREAYEEFLASDELRSIMAGKRQVLYGIDFLRKICNHPDLRDHKRLSSKPGFNYGNPVKSGKMQVVKALLELWRDQGHRTLLFAQHRIMLDILQKFVKTLPGFNYRRMDGTTPIHTRQSLVDEFNSNPDAHVFLLTTKVGGLGINLTGADRVIIFDPDWNPSTDVQARERAWRLGQKREVMIYRLMTSGTIEEKIYHRQLFKQFLINKILREPKQRQTFQMKDLHDLFTLGGADELSTETGGMFKGTEVNFKGLGEGSEAGPKPGDENAAFDAAGSSIAADVAVRNLTGVASLERFAGNEDEESKNVDGDAKNSEARVMEGIFARSGVHAALEHDQIVNGKRVLAADPHIIEQEAKRVAALAAKELKKAGEAAKNVPIGVPTWTGQFGSVGKPEEQPRLIGRGRGGPTSAGILGGLQSRNRANGGTDGSSNRTATSGSSAPKGIDFMKMIRDYIMTHGGQVHTQMLIDHFNRYCSTPARTAEFKAMLTEIATLQKGSGGRGRWRLKEEYCLSN